jgi:hypothetical protein
VTRLAALGLLLLAAVARGGDGDGITKEVADALARGDRAAALAALDAVTGPGVPRDRQRSVEAARAAMDLVGGPDGDLRAAHILVDALKLDRSDRQGAYTLAMGFKKRLNSAFDFPALRELLEGVAQLYPEDLAFRLQLASALRRAGLAEEARQEYAKIILLAPSDSDSRLALALLEEERGAIDAAIAVYDDLIALRRPPGQAGLEAHLLKTQLLRGRKHDFERARQAIEAGVAAANACEPSAQRDEYLSRFDAERRDIEADEAHRKELRALRDDVNHKLWGAVGAWVLVLGGGLALLRRARLL